jgi:DNA-binding beta-propeller fold protein YncE
VAHVPSGLLLVGQRSLALLGEADQQPRVVIDGIEPSGVAVSADGRRVTVATAGGRQRRLQEVEIASGRIVRSVPLSLPMFQESAPVLPVAYSGGAVLMTVGEGAAQRSALWEAGDDGVVAVLDGAGAVVGGADADFSGAADAVGGRAVFLVPDDRCRYEVRELRDGDGSPWRLCREPFVAFSPDGDGAGDRRAE